MGKRRTGRCILLGVVLLTMLAIAELVWNSVLAGSNQWEEKAALAAGQAPESGTKLAGAYFFFW